jgi:Domain of unknown function (DUF4956)
MISTLLQAVTAAPLDDMAEGFHFFDKISWKFFFRLGIDLLAVFVLIRFIYYKYHKSKELFFTFFIFNVIIFFISNLLNKVDMSMGAAFGLFAVFSMLRYRTEEISNKDMTYMFLCIAMGLISAVARGGWDELILIDSILLLVTFVLESNIFMKKENVKLIMYEKIENIKDGNAEILLSDLKERTGYNVHRYSIQKIDFLKDTVFIKIYYYDSVK